MQAVGSCSQQAVENSEGPREGSGERRAGIQSGERVVYADWEQQRELLLHPRNRLFVPRSLRHRGLLWFRAQLVSHLFRFNAAVERAVASRLAQVERAAAGSAGSVLAVHVRRGDKYVESATIAREAYEAAASAMVKRHNVSGVIVASDDAEQARGLEAWAHAQGLEVLNAWREEARHRGPNNMLALSTHSLDLVTYALTGMVTASTLALGQLFLGTFSSNLSRLAFELALARRRPRAPPCSLDLLWAASP